MGLVVDSNNSLTGRSPRSAAALQRHNSHQHSIGILQLLKVQGAIDEVLEQGEHGIQTDLGMELFAPPNLDYVSLNSHLR